MPRLEKNLWRFFQDTIELLEGASDVLEQSLRLSIASRKKLFRDIEHLKFQGGNRKTKNKGPEHNFLRFQFVKEGTNLKTESNCDS